tara:strand:- start:61 stop:255 length:195 start_codon:yes stop_codon:yes gene_type:complete
MPIENTDYGLTFKAPTLPIAPMEYEQQYFDRVNSVLRIYFNQLDEALRSNTLANKVEAANWFTG